MRVPVACSIAFLLTWPAVAGAAGRELSVRVLDGKDRPASGIDLLLCPLGAGQCLEAATTDGTGTARFHEAPREIVFVRIPPTADMCGPTQERVDLRAEHLGAVTLRLPPRGNLGVRLLEYQATGSPRPLRTTEVKVKVRPSPALPNGLVLGTYWPKAKAPSDRFEVCVAPGGAYDVEVEVQGFYLGSAHAPGPAEGGTTDVAVTLRRKPKS